MSRGFDEAKAHTDRALADLRAEMMGAHSSLQRTFVTWLLASQGTVVAAVGVMLLATR